jgi:hypothetical protein
MTVIELVQNKLKTDANEDDFLKSLKPVLDNFLKKQPGFQKPWEIYKSEDGTWTEIVSGKQWNTQSKRKTLQFTDLVKSSLITWMNPPYRNPS